MSSTFRFVFCTVFALPIKLSLNISDTLPLPQGTHVPCAAQVAHAVPLGTPEGSCQHKEWQQSLGLSVYKTWQMECKSIGLAGSRRFGKGSSPRVSLSPILLGCAPDCVLTSLFLKYLRVKAYISV